MPKKSNRGQGQVKKASILLDLAKDKFRSLTKAERKLFKAFANGERADFSVDSEENNDPAHADRWSGERVLKADRIAWLCTDPQASALVTHRGIVVLGARIDGKLDLQFAKISFSLSLRKSSLPVGLNLEQTEIPALFLHGTHTGPIKADGLKVKGGVFLDDGFRASGEVCLLGATIGGSLDCSNGHLISPENGALVADGLKVERNVFLRDGFEAEGEVRLSGATIGGQVDCSGGQFINRNRGGRALSADEVNVRASVFLSDGFRAEGPVCLYDAAIGGTLECEDGQFINSRGYALGADRLKIENCVHLCGGFKAEGEVCLLGAKIGGSLECDKGQFINPDGVALNADSVEVKGDIFLRNGFKGKGEVRMLGTTTGGNLECDKSQFINPDGVALSADVLKVERSVFLRNGFKAEGEVRMLDVTIGGQFDCSEGQFINPDGVALNADRLKVDGSVFLNDGFKAEGEVCLDSATIVKTLVWTNIESPEKTTLNLQLARIGTLWDDQESWPESGKLHLHGLVYDEIDEHAPTDAQSRIDWLHRQPTKHFRTQPYEQLAKVLRKSGHDSEAKRILIAKAKDRARLAKLTWPEKFWYHFLGKSIGYGYRPLRACWFVLAFVLLGWFLFEKGYREDFMTPSKESAYVSGSSWKNLQVSENYPKFNSLVYSIDTFVPLVDLHQASYWFPNANRRGEMFNIKMLRWFSGSELFYYKLFHTIMGWLFTTLLVVGLTGLIRS